MGRPMEVDTTPTPPLYRQSGCKMYNIQVPKKEQLIFQCIFLHRVYFGFQDTLESP